MSKNYWAIFLGCLMSFHATPSPAVEDCVTGTLEQFANDAMEVTSEAGCPNPTKLGGICFAVENLTKGADGKFAYKEHIANSACIKESDSVELKQKKIQRMWDQLQSDLKCSSDAFLDGDVGIMKVAIKSRFTNFIADAADVWQVNIDTKDESDGLTVLEYLDKEIAASKGTSNESILLKYKERLVAAKNRKN